MGKAGSSRHRYHLQPKRRLHNGSPHLWAIFDDNYVMYEFDHRFWLYGIRENIKAPSFTPSPADFSNRFQP
jgi:hypothetical protein